jgi:glycosyltransferase involved in cell wall biosynthesis
MTPATLTVLQVNHGYPTRYNAGSEVYTQNLSHALRRAGHQVAVFAREENPYLPDFSMHTEQDGPIDVHLVNMARSQQRWQHGEVDLAFGTLLGRLRPDAVHFHHLNHLSTGLIGVAAARGVPVVFTVHDFWLVCPRGQLVQWSLGGEPWPLCPGQDDHRCAQACFARSFSGLEGRRDDDEAHWRGWVSARMAFVERQLRQVDAFLCPSHTVARALVQRFPHLGGAVGVVDYGFPDRPVSPPAPQPVPTFGYLGTHAPTKGVDLLIRAFRRLEVDARLRIYGRSRGQESEALARAADGDTRISFEGEYLNDQVLGLLSELDAIVVPSIWLENSPLVIHEAQQARRCVITADAGGMAEYVAHEVNGLLFKHRCERSLHEQLRRVAEDRHLATRLGQRGYLHRADGRPLSIDAQARDLAVLYATLRRRRHHAA